MLGYPSSSSSSWSYSVSRLSMSDNVFSNFAGSTKPHLFQRSHGYLTQISHIRAFEDQKVASLRNNHFPMPIIMIHNALNL